MFCEKSDLKWLFTNTFFAEYRSRRPLFFSEKSFMSGCIFVLAVWYWENPWIFTGPVIRSAAHIFAQRDQPLFYESSFLESHPRFFIPEKWFLNTGQIRRSPAVEGSSSHNGICPYFFFRLIAPNTERRIAINIKF
jgi:hypothetical protein